jgi:hypothetical protein
MFDQDPNEHHTMSGSDFAQMCDYIKSLEQQKFELLEVCKIAAKAEIFDLSTGIIDADILEVVQESAREILAKHGGQS